MHIIFRVVPLHLKSRRGGVMSHGNLSTVRDLEDAVSSVNLRISCLLACNLVFPTDIPKF